ncbi:zinc-dependent alcohol dehydrogenase family protein [Pseudomonas tolaasii]
MAESMKRWEIASIGLHKLQKVSAQRPVPEPGEILVRVGAVSLNYRDYYVLEDKMGVKLDFPFTPTSDMAGTVVGVGPGVTRFKEGDRVVSMCITEWIDGAPLGWDIAAPQGGPIPGMLAQYVATPAEWCVHAPHTLDLAQASTLPIAALTAWTALVELGRIRAGQTVVVQGTGGVSLFAAQFALINGANVIVTTSSESKRQQVLQMGVQHVIDRNTVPEWQHAVLELTGGKGADHIVEVVGGDNVARSLEALKQGGEIFLIGFLGSTELSISIMPVLAKRAKITGISVGPRRAMEDMILAIDQHGLKPVIEAVYPFDQAPAAFEHLVRGAFGKVVINVS